jgi:DNA-directed RNA polymerase subunit L
MAPRVEVIVDTRTRLECVVHDIDLSVANALRRTILAHVDNVAVAHGDVLVAINTCPLHNDIISKRISMIPIKLSGAEVAAYVPNSLTLELHVKNDTKLSLDVTTEHVELLLHGKPYPNKRVALAPCKVTGDYILITRLQQGQEIQLGATASKGCADAHACYAVASVASYGYEKDDAEIAVARKQLEDTTKDLDDLDRRKKMNRFDTIDCQRIFKRAPGGEPNAFRFVVESESGLTCAEIVAAALAKLVISFRNPVVEVGYIREDETHAKFVVADESYSFGSVLQSVAVDHAAEFGLISTGFYKPHPLENQIVIQVKSQEPIARPHELLDKLYTLSLRRLAALQEQFSKALAE